jgi:UDP-GlcNAc:undecaprenyl-phosphate GlcNAc-1-phosphate transferase
VAARLGRAVSIAALAAAAVAFATALCVLAALMHSAVARRVLDHPGARSMHSVPTPRIGGLGVLAGLAAALAIGPGALPPSVYVALMGVAAISVVDDVRGLGAGVRLPLHLLAAAIAAAGTLPEAGWPLVAATTVLLAWGTNLFNFMDGSDALAGSMAVAGFATYAAAAAPTDPTLAAACLAVAAAAAGFLRYNLPPARLFMGDVGSTSLGLLAGAIGALGVGRGLWSPLLPAMAFMPFVFDATATLADRALRRRRVWEAHREHAYQRLNLGGLGHRRTASVYAALMVCSGAVALLAHATHLEWAALGALTVLHAVLWLSVRLGRLTKPRAGSERV